MDRYDQTVVDGVFRQSETFVAGQGGVGVVSGDQKESVGIVAARSTHDIDEQLVQPVEQFVGSILVCGVREADLIAAFENQMMVVIAEPLCDLMPERGITRADARIVLTGGTDPSELAVATVVMHVDDDVQTGFVTPIDGLLHSGHPYRIDVAGIRILPILPGDWNTDGIESRFFDEEGAVAGEWLVEPQSLLVFRRPHSPGGDFLVTLVIQWKRVKSVAQIPAESEAAHKLKCRSHSYASLVLLMLLLIGCKNPGAAAPT